MVAKTIPKVKPTYEPYEEDICGSHEGQSIEIECENGITIKIQQMDSGIGPSFVVTAHHAQIPEAKSRLSAFVDDDGVFHSIVEGVIPSWSTT